MTDNDQSLRDHLLYLLRNGGAHMSFDDFVGEFPAELCAERVPGLPYTCWQVLEHMRLAQWDILEFSRDPNHTSPEFPKGYWPAPENAGTVELWKESAARFSSDLKKWRVLLQTIQRTSTPEFHMGMDKQSYARPFLWRITTPTISANSSSLRGC